MTHYFESKTQRLNPSYHTCKIAMPTATPATGTRLTSTHSSPALKQPRSYTTELRSPGCGYTQTHMQETHQFCPETFTYLDYGKNHKRIRKQSSATKARKSVMFQVGNDKSDHLKRDKSKKNHIYVVWLPDVITALFVLDNLLQTRKDW